MTVEAKSIKEVAAQVSVLQDRVKLLEQIIFEEEETVFINERQQWVDECRERAAQRRRTS